MLSDSYLTERLRELAIAARTNYLAFFVLFSFLNKNKVGPLQEYLCSIIQEVADDERVPRQIVSIPPQHGKSEVFCRIAPAWIMGAFPGSQVGISGFDHELVLEFSDVVRTYVQHPWYKTIFPDAELDNVSMLRKANWGLTNGSRLRARSVGKKFTGRRLDWLFIDDAHAGREEAESPTIRRKIVNWFQGDCYSRRARNSKFFIIGTRWHPEDLAGFLTSDDRIRDLRAAGQEDEIYQLNNLPAIADPLDGEPDLLGREAGEPLAPELGRDLEFLEQTREAQFDYEWNSQYMGRPEPAASHEVDVTKIQKIELDQIPEGLEWTRGWDLAITEKQASDFTAGALLGFDEKTNSLYLADMWHGKKGWIELRQVIKQIALDEYKGLNFGHEDEPEITKIGMEAVSGFGVALVEIREDLKGKVKVEKRNPRKSKLARSRKWLRIIDAGRFHIVRGHWNKKFIDELRSFPGGSHDDQVDAVSVAWEVHSKPFKVFVA